MKYPSILKSVILIGIVLIFTGCAAMFMPKKQKISFVVKNKNTTVYLDKEEIGKGSVIKQKVRKEGPHQLVAQTPGYKDNYIAFVQYRRPIAYWFLLPLNIFNLGYGLAFDPIVPKNMAYPRAVMVDVSEKLVTRGPEDKYIDISSIKLNIANKNKDINEFGVFYTPVPSEMIKKCEELEKNKEAKDLKKEMKEAKKKKKKGKTLEEDNKEIKYDDTKFSWDVYRTLKRSGFVDTVNKVFTDNNNTLILEGSISKINFFWVYGKQYSGTYYKSKVYLKWYLKNTYGEVFDSVSTSEFSGDFTLGYLKDGDTYRYEKIIGDAIDNSYLKLHKSFLTKYMKQEKAFSISDPLLTLKEPRAVVTEKTDASSASVIVKTKYGHGSGFAITQDGYIITNYHVISSRVENKPLSIKILTSSGDELEGKVIRTNKYRDLALIKVDKEFEKAFRVSNAKSFKNLQDVYTIGAPKSIELGQSISTGVISNERKSNNNHLLQLSMPINGGNSGGPLFDNSGTLHGVVVSKLVGQNTEGIGFAIPGFLLEQYLNIKYSPTADAQVNPHKKK
jgi:serine protease Do